MAATKRRKSTTRRKTARPRKRNLSGGVLHFDSSAKMELAKKVLAKAGIKTHYIIGEKASLFGGGARDWKLSSWEHSTGEMQDALMRSTAPSLTRNPEDFYSIGKRAFVAVQAHRDGPEGHTYGHKGYGWLTHYLHQQNPNFEVKDFQRAVYSLYPVQSYEKHILPPSKLPRKRTLNPEFLAAKAEFERGWGDAVSDFHGRPRQSNPGPGSTTQLYSDFHGRPSSETLTITERLKEHDNLTGLGDLVELKFNSLTGFKVHLTYDPKKGRDGIILCSSADRRQLYFVGGNQGIDLKKFNMGPGSKWYRDLMVLGTIQVVTYRTEKGFDDFVETDYFHKLGEETKVRPVLMYDTLSNRMEIVGGQYEVRPEGIVN